MASMCSWQNGNARCNVHGIDQTQAFLDAALADQRLDGAGDVEVIPPVRRLEPEMFR